MDDSRDLTKLERARMLALKNELHKWKVRKGQLMRQYSRCKNLRDRDNNTRYFHNIANIKNKRRLITQIEH